eukprot:TRINITY_DN1491_c0_g1_i3.p1 TRINITY_DN1491_c0_g1~~TRINITY_DN1491_c0_g1_i3.p1  ORF type:complete len:2603 (+),score=361.71 TRINITY_DN1491_c0_g1_i3:137-7945(+)
MEAVRPTRPRVASSSAVNDHEIAPPPVPRYSLPGNLTTLPYPSVPREEPSLPAYIAPSLLPSFAPSPPATTSTISTPASPSTAHSPLVAATPLPYLSIDTSIASAQPDAQTTTTATTTTTTTMPHPDVVKSALPSTSLLKTPHAVQQPAALSPTSSNLQSLRQILTDAAEQNVSEPVADPTEASVPYTPIYPPLVSLQETGELLVFTTSKEATREALANYLQPLVEVEAIATAASDQIEEREKSIQDLLQVRRVQTEVTPDIMEPIAFDLRKNQIKSPFYRMLAHYRSSQSQVVKIDKKIKGLKAHHDQMSSVVWVDVPKVTEIEGFCADRAKLKQTHEYHVWEYNAQLAPEIASNLLELYEISTHERTKHQYNCQAVRQQIEVYIDEFFQSSPLWTSLSYDTPVSALGSEDELAVSASYLADIERLREHVTILMTFEKMHFIRPLWNKSPTPDKLSLSAFYKDVRGWLLYMGGVLVRCARYEDHAFLLEHVMSCPHAGEWAAQLIQFPAPGLWTEETCQHFVRQLGRFVRPMALRMLRSPASQNPPSMLRRTSMQGEEEVAKGWVLVDTNEESVEAVDYTEPEDSDQPFQPSSNTRYLLTEDDFIALFDQFGFATFVQSLVDIHIKQAPSPSMANAQIVLAASTEVLTLVASSFKVFSQHHRHLVKVMAKLMSTMIASIAVAVVSCFPYVPYDVQPKLQEQLDHYLLLSLELFLATRKLGVWQFITLLPYQYVSHKMQWLHFALLLAGTADASNTISISFDGWLEALVSSSQSKDSGIELKNAPHILGLVNAFVALMHKEEEGLFLFHAIARLGQSASPALKRVIILLLFYVAFVDPVTRDQFYKNGRDVLATICNADPELNSTIVLFIRKFRPSAIGASPVAYLLNGLPLRKWLPLDEDLQVIRSFLKQPWHSDENKLGRYLLSNLNWGPRVKNMPMTGIGDSGDVLLPPRTVGEKESDHRQRSISSSIVSPIPSQEEALVLGADFHRKVLLLLVDASCEQCLYAPKKEGARSSSLGNNTGAFIEWVWPLVLATSHFTPARIARLPRMTLEQLPSSIKSELTLEHGITQNPLVAYLLCELCLGAEPLPIHPSAWPLLKLLIDYKVVKAAIRVITDLCPTMFAAASEIPPNEDPLRDIFKRLVEPEAQTGGLFASMFSGFKQQPRATPADLTDNAQKLSASVAHYLLQAAAASSVPLRQLPSTGILTVERRLVSVEMLGSDRKQAVENTISYTIAALCGNISWGSLETGAGRQCLEHLLKFAWPCELSFKLIHSLFRKYFDTLGQNSRNTYTSWVSHKTPPPLSLLTDDDGTGIARLPAAPNILAVLKQFDNHFMKYPFLAFEILCLETMLESPARVEVGTLITERNQDNPNVMEQIAKDRGFWKTLGYFSIYKWAEFGLILDMDAPLLPIVFHIFFLLFFQRNAKGLFIGNKFLDTTSSFELRDKVQQRLTILADYHNSSAERLSAKSHLHRSGMMDRPTSGGFASEESEQREIYKVGYHTKLAALYHAMSLWFKEAKLGPRILFEKLQGLSQAYLPSKLLLFHTDSPLTDLKRSNLWLEFVDFIYIEDELALLAGAATLAQRLPQVPPPTSIVALGSTASAPLTLFGSSSEIMDAHVKNAPVLMIKLPAIRPFPIDMNLEYIFATAAGVLMHYATQYEMRVSRHYALDQQYIINLPFLYTNLPMTKIFDARCGPRCKGSAQLVLSFVLSSPNDQASMIVTTNRREVDDFIDNPPVIGDELVINIITLMKTIDELIKLQRASLVNSYVHQVGCRLFYLLCGKILNATSDLYPPTHSMIRESITEMAITFVVPDPEQTASFLGVMLANPLNLKMFTSYFAPSKPEVIPIMYKMIFAERRKHTAATLIPIIMKLSIEEWLATLPAPAEIAEMLAVFTAALLNFTDIKSLKLLDNEAAASAFGLDTPPSSPKLVGDINPGLQQSAPQPPVVDGIKAREIEMRLLLLGMRHLLMYRFPEHFSEFVGLLMRNSCFVANPVATPPSSSSSTPHNSNNSNNNRKSSETNTPVSASAPSSAPSSASAPALPVETRILPPAAWAMLATLPLHKLSPELLASVATWFHNYFWDMRRGSSLPLYTVWGEKGYQTPYLAFLKTLFTNPWIFPTSGYTMPALSSPTSEPFPWTLIERLYSGWLVAEAGFQCWLPNQSKEAQEVVSSFVEHTTMCIGYFPQTIHIVWDYFNKQVFKHASPQMFAVLHPAFLQFPWQVWQFSIQDIHELIKIAQIAFNTAPYYFYVLRDIIPLLNMTPMQPTSDYYGSVLVLLLLFLHNHPLPIRGPFVSFIANSPVFATQWTSYLSAVTLSAIVVDKAFSDFMQGLLSSGKSATTPAVVLPPPVIDVSPDETYVIQTSHERFTYTLKILRDVVGFTEPTSQLFHLGVGEHRSESAKGEDMQDELIRIKWRLEKLHVYTRFLLNLYTHGSEAPESPSSALMLAEFRQTLTEIFQYINRLCGRGSNRGGGGGGGEQQLPPVLHEDVVRIFQDIVALYNSPSTEVNNLVKFVMTEIVSDSPAIIAAALESGCRSIISVQTLAAFSENCIDRYFLVSSDWTTLMASLQVPEIDEEDFLESCVQRASVNTLYTYWYVLF